MTCDQGQTPSHGRPDHPDNDAGLSGELISGRANFQSFASFKAYAAKLKSLHRRAADGRRPEPGHRVRPDPGELGRRLLTEATWDRLYVVVSVIWPLTRESAHEQLVKSFMKPALQETNMVVSRPPRRWSWPGP